MTVNRQAASSGAVDGLRSDPTAWSQARPLAESRGLVCVEVDLARLRGERQPELTLFA
jgi:hypothetical protein